MAELTVDDQNLTVELSGVEKFAALRRSEVSVPISSITSVERVTNAREHISGIRAPGTGIPGVLALGTWRRSGARDFVATTRSNPGYVIELEGQQFARLIVSSPVVAQIDDLQLTGA